mmetsp:Transcript_20496/g.53384  ORF Transcript_20496/g.53384 Transcript_20496/m.53384 type:complete len:238 (-) Transcript_20496:2897-3610(-)
MLSRSRPRAARAVGRQALDDFDGNTSDEFDEDAPYAQPHTKHVQRASSDPVTETPNDTSDESPGESPDNSGDEWSGEPPQESGDEWSGDPPEDSGDESPDESPDTSSEVASRKRPRDEDSNEPAAKRTANQTSESSQDSDVDEPQAAEPTAFDEEKATADAKKMTVAKLRSALGAIGQKTGGLKAELVERLVDAQRAASVPVRKSNVTSPSTPSTRRRLPRHRCDGPRRRSGVSPLI